MQTLEVILVRFGNKCTVEATDVSWWSEHLVICRICVFILILKVYCLMQKLSSQIRHTIVMKVG